MSKWLYGYDPYGRFLDFLAQGLEPEAGYSYYLSINPAINHASMEIMTTGGLAETVSGDSERRQ